MKSKTVKLEILKERVNRTLADPAVSYEVKEYAATLLENVLLQRKSYAGFMFLNTEPSPTPLKGNYFDRKYF
jgi:hypothetical protein